MLQDSQRAYLDNLDPERAASPVLVRPYDPRIGEIAQAITEDIKTKLLEADVRFMGASALGISGQNDIDIYILTNPEDRALYAERLQPLFGQLPNNKWRFERDGIDVSIHLYDPNGHKAKEHLKLFHILSSNPDILAKYEELKLSMSGRSYRDYQIAKYEFYNTLLGKE